MQAFFDMLGMENSGAAHIHMSAVPLNATPLAGAAVHEGQGHVKPPPGRF